MKKNYFYCFNKITKSWIFLGNEEALLTFIVKGASNNFLIRNASLSFKDEVFGTFVFCDKDFNIIDIRDYEDDVKKHKKEMSFYISHQSFFYNRYKKQRCSNNFDYGQILYRNVHSNYIPYAYRKDPVPGLNKFWKYAPERNLRYKQIISTLKNPEKKEFIRTKHYATLINGAFDYDNFFGRCNQKSWKKKKIKHQWQKNL